MSKLNKNKNFNIVPLLVGLIAILSVAVFIGYERLVRTGTFANPGYDLIREYCVIDHWECSATNSQFSVSGKGVLEVIEPNKAITNVLYYHDVDENTWREIKFDEASRLTLSVEDKAPDGYGFETRSYSDGFAGLTPYKNGYFYTKDFFREQRIIDPTESNDLHYIVDRGGVAAWVLK